MPIYEYKCVDCEEVLEVLHFDANNIPKRCGFRCRLGPEDPRECRGMGELKRLHSMVNVKSLSSINTKPMSVEEAAKAGFTVYKNQGDGHIKKIAGEKGPNDIKV